MGETNPHFISHCKMGLGCGTQRKRGAVRLPFLKVIELEFLEAESDRSTNNSLVFANRSVRD